MRNLILSRKRALACFAIPYYCVLGNELPDGKSNLSAAPVRNGQRISLPIPEEEVDFYVAIPAERQMRFTQIVTIPAGTADVSYTVITDYNGNDRLGFYLERNAITE